MVRRVAHFVLVLILAQFATSFSINNTVLEDNDINLTGLKTRRKRDRSTSSDSGSIRTGRDGSSESGVESLNVVFTSSSSSSSSDSTDTDGLPKNKKKKKRREPKSTIERRGWRKWHRKCTKCPEEMAMKWRDPGIKWICGAYQQARRTFKSECMMYFRNCQDGTMFTKIADHRCPNGTQDGVHPYNNHFFYDYKADLTDESTSSSSDSRTTSISDSDDSEDSSSSVNDAEIEKNIPPFVFDRDR